MPFRPKIRAFLAAIETQPNVTRAAKAAQINKAHHYAKLKTSPEYAAAFATAWELGCDALSDVAIERATDGWQEPIVYQGSFSYPLKWDRKKRQFVPDFKKPPLTVRKIDNNLLFNILKARHPEYRERDQKIQPADAPPLVIQVYPHDPVEPAPEPSLPSPSEVPGPGSGP